jgi:hypothetical protein
MLEKTPPVTTGKTPPVTAGGERKGETDEFLTCELFFTVAYREPISGQILVRCTRR